MRVAVVGGSGGTGRLLTGQALDGGHAVVAITYAYRTPLLGNAARACAPALPESLGASV